MTWWRPMLNQTLVYQQRAGNGVDGGATFGTKTTLANACRHERQSTSVSTSDSEETIITDVFATEVELRRGDRVWRPGDDSSDDSLVLIVRDVRQAPDMVSPSAQLLEVVCG